MEGTKDEFSIGISLGVGNIKKSDVKMNKYIEKIANIISNLVKKRKNRTISYFWQC